MRGRRAISSLGGGALRPDEGEGYGGAYQGRRHGALRLRGAASLHVHRSDLRRQAWRRQEAVMQHLLVAADRYGLDRLRLMCEVELCRGIDARTVATTLALAEQHRCARLKDACLAYVASRDVLGAVMKTDGFKHLAASCPLVLVEILDAIVKGKGQ